MKPDFEAYLGGEVGLALRPISLPQDRELKMESNFSWWLGYSLERAGAMT